MDHSSLPRGEFQNAGNQEESVPSTDLCIQAKGLADVRETCNSMTEMLHSMRSEEKSKETRSSLPYGSLLEAYCVVRKNGCLL